MNIAVRVLLLLPLASQALGARLDPDRVFRSVSDFLDPGKDRMVTSVCPALDGAVWIVGLQSWDEDGYGSNWYVRRVAADDAHPDMETALFPDSLSGRWRKADPGGSTADGSLVLEAIERGPVGSGYLVRVSPQGSVELSGELPPHASFYPNVFVDRDGIAHLRVTRSSRGWDYAQVDVMRAGMPVRRTLDYDKPFDGHASAPAYLRWDVHVGTATIARLAFYGEDDSKLLVATPHRTDSSASYQVRRIDTRSLALLDSSLINLARDVYRSWSGPRFLRTTVVPAHGSGYWLFHPTGDSPPAPTILAYRLQPDLQVIRPPTADVDSARAYDLAPADVVTQVQCAYNRWPGRENGSPVMHASVTLTVTAFDGDGRLYTQTYVKTTANRIAE